MPMMLDRDIHQSSALVIDANATSRSILIAQLRDFGVGVVAQCGRIADARLQLESKKFDVVLCEQDFGGNEGSGQQLLDDLRRQQLLPLTTVFIMITAQATYSTVAEAAESALDGYLIKPHTAASLAERMSQARRRKKVLNDIFLAIDQNRLQDAAALCERRFAERAEFWGFAARIGAELLLRLNQHRQAGELFAAALQAQPAPWARLGVARAQAEGNDLARAAQTLQALAADQPSFVDVHDVAGRVQLDLGNFDDAFGALRRAAALTPGSVARQQKLGMLAFFMAEADEATLALERAVSLGISSKSFDPQTHVLLALLRFRKQDGKGLQRCADNLEHAASRQGESARLQRFVLLVQVLSLVQARADAADALKVLCAQTREHSFDIEAAANLLCLLSQLAAQGVALENADQTVDQIGLRHCASKGLSELLVRAAAAHAPFAERVRNCHQRVLDVSEKAMAHSLAGDPAAAASSLLDDGKASLNGKLIDNAGMVLLRHRERIPDATRLLEEVQALRSRYGHLAGKLTLGDASGRQAGALALRTSVVNVSAVNTSATNGSAVNANAAGAAAGSVADAVACKTGANGMPAAAAV